MLALQELEKDIGPHGIPMSEATDPVNQFAFETAKAPVIDWAARALAAGKKSYYDQYDTDKKRPMDRSGHLWGVTAKKKPDRPNQ